MGVLLMGYVIPAPVLVQKTASLARWLLPVAQSGSLHSEIPLRLDFSGEGVLQDESRSPWGSG